MVPKINVSENVLNTIYDEIKVKIEERVSKIEELTEIWLDTTDKELKDKKQNELFKLKHESGVSYLTKLIRHSDIIDEFNYNILILICEKLKKDNYEITTSEISRDHSALLYDSIMKQ
jgi:hypothetical protein